METPPVIKPPEKAPGKRLLGGCLIALIAAFTLIALLVYLAMPRPPSESKLIQNFNAKRAAFEQLRDMLQADSNLRRVADWGIETSKPFYSGHASASHFPMERYNQYLALLKQAGGKVAVRNEGEHADPSILVWGWGFAGNTKHVGISWKDQVPTNQVPSLDGYHGGSQNPDRVVVFRHLDENWYRWTDL